MDEEKKIEEIATYISTCPVCKKTFVVKDYKYNVPYYGDVIITVAECENCGYKYRDVLVASGNEPRKVVYRVEEPGDDNALLIKNSTCRIEIPELGVSIEPGAYSQGYITTVEGLILEIIEVADHLCRQENSPREKCNEVKDLLEKARKNETPYTVIIYDNIGVCDIISSRKKPVYEKLNT
ncbi:MAG: ZPR1 zinc finger domain-containing protein [Desulfurococcaceae archaeon]